jgi:hypothetical protein
MHPLVKAAKAVNPHRAKARWLVRMACKAFGMRLSFDTPEIDPGSEFLFWSHEEKVNKMKDWAGNPFANILRKDMLSC